MANIAGTIPKYALLALLLIQGCHASEDDPAGLAAELDDPVRREHAIAHIQKNYSAALTKAQNNREDAAVKAVVDATVVKIAESYVKYGDDTQNGTLMIRTLADMRDVRALPAFLDALDWRTEVNEDHAVTAAETLRDIKIPADKIGSVVDALAKALEKVTTARGKDAQMRVAFINAIGLYADQRAVPVLTKVMLSDNEAQNFVFNILAAEKLAKIADPGSVPSFIRALFVFAPGQPAMRMNDVASGALIRIGRPSLEPLLAVLAGKDEVANGLALRYLEAVRKLNAQAAEQMSVAMLTSAESTFALGGLGFRDSFDALMAEASSEDPARRMNAAIALVRLDLDAAQQEKVRALLLDVYAKASSPDASAQLIAVMRSTYDSAFLETFMAAVKDVENLHPAIRLTAAEAYALLANKAESAVLGGYIEGASEDSEPYRDDLTKQYNPMISLAVTCDVDVACWVSKLSSSDKLELRKSAYMLGRLARGNADAVKALVPLLGHAQIEVRLAALNAVDRIADKGSPEAVAKIDSLEATEGGRKIWKDFAREGLPIRSRLVHRGK
jgi:hypothetical protein